MTFRRIISLAVAAVLGSTAATAQTPTSTADVIPNTRTPPRSEIALADRAFRDLIGCVVRYQPERTRNLVDTIPGTRDEERILFSFQSRMETCYDSFRTGRGALLIQPNLIRGVVAETWAGVLLPSATPQEVVEVLQRAFVRAGRSDARSGKLKAMRWEPVNGTPEEFRRFMASESDKYAKVSRAAGIKPE